MLHLLLSLEVILECIKECDQTCFLLVTFQGCFSTFIGCVVLQVNEQHILQKVCCPPWMTKLFKTNFENPGSFWAGSLVYHIVYFDILFWFFALMFWSFPLSTQLQLCWGVNSHLVFIQKEKRPSLIFLEIFQTKIKNRKGCQNDS